PEVGDVGEQDLELLLVRELPEHLRELELEPRDLLLEVVEVGRDGPHLGQAALEFELLGAHLLEPGVGVLEQKPEVAGEDRERGGGGHPAAGDRRELRELLGLGLEGLVQLHGVPPQPSFVGGRAAARAGRFAPAFAPSAAASGRDPASEAFTSKCTSLRPFFVPPSLVPSRSTSVKYLDSLRLCRKSATSSLSRL